MNVKNFQKFTVSCGILLSISTLSYSKSKTSVRSLKDKLNTQSADVAKIGATIRTIEKQLGETNDTYINKTRNLKNIDSKILILKENLTKSATEISKSYKVSKNILNQYLLDKIDDKSGDKLLKKKIYFKLLAGNVQKLKVAQNSSSKLLEAIQEYEKRAKSARINEETLYNLIVELENKKKLLGSDYISKMEKKNEMEELLETAIARQKNKKSKSNKRKKVARSTVNIGMEITNPISNYINIKGSKKGVTYTYNKVEPIKSTQNGQIVYAGELASYGKVIMIDHGKDIRSVILGDFSIKVKKGDIVNKDGVIGYTNVDPGVSKSLYYEVRKKNIAQNTLNLLKKNNKNI
jgi:murein DD-endopeptidase MepM/ murein hydrolase activator NlpD